MNASERYTLESVIKRGQGGIVYSAWDNALGRAVACKVLRGTFADTPERLRFSAEAKIAARLEHPNIIPIHDVGETAEGDPYYVMKKVDRAHLGDLIDACHRGAPDLTHILELLHVYRGVLQAMAFAHARGFLHRDLKPSNVLCGQWGEVLVIDWGLALQFRGDAEVPEFAWVNAAPRLTRQGEPLGTHKYMSPEQCRGELDRVGPASDVYSLGVLLYHLLTGTHPRRAETRRMLLSSFQRDEVVAPSARRRGAPECRRLDGLTLACLAVSQELRPPDAGALLQIFDDTLRSWRPTDSAPTARTVSGEFQVQTAPESRRTGEHRGAPRGRSVPPESGRDLVLPVDEFEGLEEPAAV